MPRRYQLLSLMVVALPPVRRSLAKNSLKADVRPGTPPPYWVRVFTPQYQQFSKSFEKTESVEFDCL